jgi:hypothetical protein
MTWRSFWAGHQAFFRHMTMAAKVPAVVRMARAAVAAGKCAVIGLQSTGEARTADVVADRGDELDDFVSGPKELLLRLVDNYYPLPPDPYALSQEAGGCRALPAGLLGLLPRAPLLLSTRHAWPCSSAALAPQPLLPIRRKCLGPSSAPPVPSAAPADSGSDDDYEVAAVADAVARNALEGRDQVYRGAKARAVRYKEWSESGEGRKGEGWEVEGFGGTRCFTAHACVPWQD